MKSVWIQRHKIVGIFLLLYLLFSAMPLVSFAKMVSEKTDTEVEEQVEGDTSFAADSLTIQIGYYGGTYQEKKVFTLKELQAMEQIRQEYSYINVLPNVVVDYVEGVRLIDILESSGIDLDSIAEFHFYTSDVSGTYFNTFTKEFLLGTDRYYFPYLRERFDYESGKGKKGADEAAVSVVPLLALRENWTTFPLDDPSEGFAGMTEKNRFRLAYGQRNTYEVTSKDSAKWIHSIYVTLNGYPTKVSFDVSLLKLKMGSSYQLEAQIEVSDDSADQTLLFSSSDESVATVDENGMIRIHGEGKAEITAVTVNGIEAKIVVQGLLKDNEDDFLFKKEEAYLPEGADLSETSDSVETFDSVEMFDLTEKLDSSETMNSSEEELLEENKEQKEEKKGDVVEAVTPKESNEDKEETQEKMELVEREKKQQEQKKETKATLQTPRNLRIYELPETALAMPEFIDPEKEKILKYLVPASLCGFFFLGAVLHLICYRLGKNKEGIYNEHSVK